MTKKEENEKINFSVNYNNNSVYVELYKKNDLHQKADMVSLILMQALNKANDSDETLKYVIQVGRERIVTLSEKGERQGIFKHFLLNGGNFLSLLNQIEYIQENDYFVADDIRVSDTTFILNGKESTTIYQCSPRISRIFTGGEARKTDYIDKNGIPYIEVKQTLCTELDELTMYLDAEKLETEQIYSKMQNRIIPIYNVELVRKMKLPRFDHYEGRYSLTYQHEIKKYIDYITEFTTNYENEMKKIAQKKLTKSFQNK